VGEVLLTGDWRWRPDGPGSAVPFRLDRPEPFVDAAAEHLVGAECSDAAMPGAIRPGQRRCPERLMNAGRGGGQINAISVKRLRAAPTMDDSAPGQPDKAIEHDFNVVQLQPGGK